MIFLVGVIVGVIIIIVALLIWYVRGAHLMTGILSDDEMMYEAGKKEEQMGSSQKTKDS